MRRRGVAGRRRSWRRAEGATEKSCSSSYEQARRPLENSADGCLRQFIIGSRGATPGWPGSSPGANVTFLSCYPPFQTGADPNSVDSLNQTALHFTAAAPPDKSHNTAEIVAALVEHKADVSVKDTEGARKRPRGHTRARQHASIAAFSRRVAHHAPARAWAPRQRSRKVHTNCVDGSVPESALLLPPRPRQHPSAPLRHKGRRSVPRPACQVRGPDRRATLLLQMSRASILPSPPPHALPSAPLPRSTQAVDKWKRTPLLVAAARSHLDAARALLQLGAGPNTQCGAWSFNGFKARGEREPEVAARPRAAGAGAFARAVCCVGVAAGSEYEGTAAVGQQEKIDCCGLRVPPWIRPLRRPVRSPLCPSLSVARSTGRGGPRSTARRRGETCRWHVRCVVLPLCSSLSCTPHLSRACSIRCLRRDSLVPAPPVPLPTSSPPCVPESSARVRRSPATGAAAAGPRGGPHADGHQRGHARGDVQRGA